MNKYKVVVESRWFTGNGDTYCPGFVEHTVEVSADYMSTLDGGISFFLDEKRIAHFDNYVYCVKE